MKLATYNTQNDAERSQGLDFPKLMTSIVGYAAHSQRPTIFIFTSGFLLKDKQVSMDVLYNNEVRTYKFSEVARFEGGVVSDEDAVIYLITREIPSPAQNLQ
jgi:hypothetical protein